MLALPLAAGLLLGGIARADQSILIRSDASAAETSATTVATLPSRPVPAAAEQVSTRFHARTGSSKTNPSVSDGAIKLKWRARHPDSFELGGASHDAAVRQATQITELNNANPFDDPFEDRTRGRFTSTRQDLVQPDSAAPGLAEPLIIPRSRDCSSCPDKCYNGRDCCEQTEKCATARKLLKQYDDITNISLNITPSINPRIKDPAKLENYKSTQLIQAKSRTWHDTDGNTLVTGSLIDFNNERVYIATDDGQTKKYPFRMLSDDDRCFVSAWWSIPAVCKLGTEKFVDRYHQPMTMTWTASQVCHKPLYFEEIALERYGHTTGPLVQPWISGAHFFTNIAILPYRMGINPLGECQYDLGYYRPGNCAPWTINPLPLSPRGALFQAGAVTGVGYLIP